MSSVNGLEMHSLMRELFPICRSITGDGVRETLSILRNKINGLEIFEVPSGLKCFDWTIPKEWNIRDAYIITPTGKKICQFSKSNLHVVGYSIPVNKSISLEELQKHLHSLPTQRKAIPYVTSYYREYWGFCISEEERELLEEGNYTVYIDSTLEDGFLTYGELIIKGNTDKEVFISTYICHPSMANNELSGPVVTAYLANFIKGLSERKYTYRIVFVPETIGSITYLSKHIDTMKCNVIAGFNVSCIGDERNYSYLPSRKEDSLADRAALHALNSCVENYITYSYLERGSDERQYCSPGVDLPVCSIMRTKYGCYPEYHTSLDDLSLVTPEGLEGGLDIMMKTIEVIEFNEIYTNNFPCEPQLGKRGLYPMISEKGSADSVEVMMNFLAYLDGDKDLIEIATLIGSTVWDLKPIVDKLIQSGVISVARNV